MTSFNKVKKHRKRCLTATKTKLAMCKVGESFFIERHMQVYVHTASIPLNVFIKTEKIESNKIKVTRTA